jgi:uncharacterized cupredoxin-like copper-binding protein
LGEIVNWRTRTRLIGAAAALVVPFTVTQAADGSGTVAAPDQLRFRLDEFKIRPRPAEARAGTLRIRARNVGDGEHELVVARTRRKPGKLPTKKNGDVREGAINVIGEISELPPGEAGRTELQVKSGRYVMFCNVSGHYAQGMYGRLNIK